MPLDTIEDPSGEGNPFGGGQEPEEAFPILSRALSRHGANDPAMLALRERALADREHIAQQSFQLRAQTEELNKVKVLADLEKERVRIGDSMELHRQTMIAARRISKLDGTEPDYQQQVLGIMADNPLATKDPILTKAISFRNEQALQRERATSALTVFQQEENQRQDDKIAGQQSETTEDEKRVDYDIAARAAAKPRTDITTETRAKYADITGQLAGSTADLKNAAADADKAKIQGNIDTFKTQQQELQKQFPGIEYGEKPTNFKDTDDAERAASLGLVKHGDKIVVGGTSGIWQDQ